MRFEHPFLVPDLLLHITQFVLLEINDSRERWAALLRISLVSTAARDILTDKASFWRWIDINAAPQVALMLQRMAGRPLRPIITYSATGDLIAARLDGVTADLLRTVPILQPEAIYTTGIDRWRHFPSSLLQSKVWGNLRVMSLQATTSAWRGLDTVLLPLAYFPKLESLYVVDHLPTPDLDDAHSSCPSLLHLAVISTSALSSILETWIQHLKYMPNLDTLSLRGFVRPSSDGPVEINLPLLRNLRIHPYFEGANHIRFNTPLLERMTFFAPLAHAVPLVKMLTPENLINMVRLFKFTHWAFPPSGYVFPILQLTACIMNELLLQTSR